MTGGFSHPIGWRSAGFRRLPTVDTVCVGFVNSLDDWARFSPEDPTPVVLAAFACPLCLRRASVVILENDSGACSATCRCTTCERTWTVALRSDQILQVGLLPERDLLVLNSAAGGIYPHWPFSGC